MRLNLLLSLALLAGLFVPFRPTLAGSAGPQLGQQDVRAFRPGAVLVGLRPAAAREARNAFAAAGLEVTEEIPELHVVSVKVPPGEEVATAARLAQRGDVAFAEPDYVASAQSVPDDPNYAKQWALPQIGMPQAWDLATGAPNIIIAIIDSGIDLGHEDLAANLWHNGGETPFNGIDDDGNGYVDDADGWHFFYSGTRGDRFVQDDYGHGTHVAGIAAAVTNNGIGVAGVAPRSRLMAVKVIDSNGLTFYSDVAAGILYATRNGASILNLSLGGVNPSEVLCNAVTTAAGAGKLVVAAAGNTDKGSAVMYPAACPGALAVAATDRTDQRAKFSLTGLRVDLSAPGDDIWSTWYATGSGLHTYRNESGTSSAAPFVSGAAALVWSRWPAWNADGVKTQLLATVKDVGWPGKDDETGWGRLDAAAALAAPAPGVELRVAVQAAPQTVIAGNPLTATFTITNAGPTAATSLTLDATLVAAPTIDAIDSGPAACRLNGTAMTCGASRLEAGASLTVSAVITPTQVQAGELITTASVSAAQPELSPADNQQTLKSAIRPMLSGRVFNDSNGDGIRQAWETRGVGDAGLYVEQNDQPIAYRPSQLPDGAYQFDTLAFDRYVLRVDLPPAWHLTTPELIALSIEPGKETVVYFGAWNGIVEPTPTPTATPSPTPSPTLEPRSRTYLPVIVHH